MRHGLKGVLLGIAIPILLLVIVPIAFVITGLLWVFSFGHITWAEDLLVGIGGQQ